MSKRHTHDLDALISRAPVNATAAKVIGPGPKGLESDKRILTVCSPTPLPVRGIRPSERKLLPNLVGVMTGSLTPIGIWVDGRPGHLRWVCRCVCGYYTTRSTKALRKATNQHDQCDRCRQVAFLRRRATYLATGRNFDEES